nr:MAG TPA: hypothetical protein [Caudoviricetes sp.]
MINRYKVSRNYFLLTFIYYIIEKFKHLHI